MTNYYKQKNNTVVHSTKSNKYVTGKNVLENERKTNINKNSYQIDRSNRLY